MLSLNLTSASVMGIQPQPRQVITDSGEAIQMLGGVVLVQLQTTDLQETVNELQTQLQTQFHQKASDNSEEHF